MGTILSLKQAPAETLDLLIARPELAVVFWMRPDYAPPHPPALLLWIAKLFGHYEPPLDLPEAPARLSRNGEEFALEEPPASLATLEEFPLGKPIVGSTHGYGDDRAIWPNDLGKLAKAPAFDPMTEPLRDFLDSTRAMSLGLVLKLS